MTNFKKTFFFFLAIIFLAVFYPARMVFAFATSVQDSIAVSESEIIESTFFAAARDIIIEGEIKGDLICAAQNLKISGTVRGDVLCVAQDAKISGKIEGDIRLASQKIEISQDVLKNATVFAEKIKTDAKIEGELFFACRKADLAGEIKGSAKGYCESMTLNGAIGKNADLRVNNLILEKDARISGDLVYESDKEAVFSYGSTVFGKIERRDAEAEILAKAQTKEKEKKSGLDSFMRNLAIYLVLALILVSFFERQTIKAAEKMLARPAKSLGWGALILVGAPSVAIALFFTIIGIPFSLLLILAYALAFALSGIIVAVAVGRLLTERYWRSKRESALAAVAIGVTVCWVAFSLPSIGWILTAAAIVWGFGGIYYLFRD